MAAMEPPEYIFSSEDLMSALGLLKQNEEKLPPPPIQIPLTRYGANRAISCSSDDDEVDLDFMTFRHLTRFKAYITRLMTSEKDTVKLETYKKKLEATNNLLALVS
jgi:hypothetical protein